jgi:hypothetical protein
LTGKFYETDEDLARERAIIDKVCSKWRCHAIKQRTNTRVDFILTSQDGRPRVVAEVRQRHNTKEKFPTLIFSEAKIKAGLRFAADRKLPFILVVQWAGIEPEFIHVTQMPSLVAKGGRTVGGPADRGDPRDIEMLAHFEVGMARPI